MKSQNKKLERKALLGLCALGLITAFARSDAARADDKEVLGTILGGVAGGLAGSGLGDGDAVATVLGAGIGAIIGNQIGEALDEKDALEAENAYLRSMEERENAVVEWRSSRERDRYGSFRPGRFYRDQRGYRCRAYVNETWIHGRLYRREGVACQGRDGRWSEWHEYRAPVHVHPRRDHHRSHGDSYPRRHRGRW